MEMAIGFIVGYLIGSRSGSLNLDEIRRAWAEISKSEEAQAFVSGGAQVALQVVRQGVSGVLGQNGNGTATRTRTGASQHP